MTTSLVRPAIDPAMASHRAGRGAAWLDDNHRDWWSAIDLDKLKVANHSACPLAWVYADYATGLDRVVAREGGSTRPYTLLVDLGFDGPLGPDDERAAYHAALQCAWSREISRRKKGPR